jgi:3-hydroxyisobutyrate dehydrogenase
LLLPIEPEEISDLPFLENLCWEMLVEGATNRKSAMHQAVISTAKDNHAYMRTVVLRRVDAGPKKIYLHTDSRSRKMEDINRNEHLSWLVYDQTLRTQIRLSGPVIVHHLDDLCKEQWDKTGHHSRRYYMTDQPPSTALDQPSTGLNAALTAFDYSMEESESGFQHFVVVETCIDWMEWYYTHSKGNRRAGFTYNNGSLSTATWLMP